MHTSVTACRGVGTWRGVATGRARPSRGVFLASRAGARRVLAVGGARPAAAAGVLA